jgi:integrase
MTSKRVEYMTKSQVDLIDRYLDTTDQERMRLITRLAFWGGMRVSEIHQIGEGEINFDQGVITLKYTKGNKPGFAPLGGEVKEALRTYIKYNRQDIDQRTQLVQKEIAEAQDKAQRQATKKGMTSDQATQYVHKAIMVRLRTLPSPLFGIKYQAIQKGIMKLPQRAARWYHQAGQDPLAHQLEITISAHTYRHSFAHWWLHDKQGDVPTLQKIMRHSSIAITVDTYGHMDMKSTMENYNRITGAGGP